MRGMWQTQAVQQRSLATQSWSKSALEEAAGEYKVKHFFLLLRWPHAESLGHELVTITAPRLRRVLAVPIVLLELPPAAAADTSAEVVALIRRRRPYVQWKQGARVKHRQTCVGTSATRNKS